MTPETTRKRKAVRSYLRGQGYQNIGPNLWQNGEQTIDLDAAEMRDRLRPRWAWIYDEHVARSGPAKSGLDYQQGEGVRPL